MTKSTEHAAHTYGRIFARQFFARHAGAPAAASEIRLTEIELAAVVAVAYKAGILAGEEGR